MASRGFMQHLTAQSRRGLTLAWAALFALSLLLQYTVMTGPARAGQVASNKAAGALQAVAQNCGYTPLDIEIVLDTSGSMTSNSSAGQTRLYWAKAAAVQLINDLGANGGIGGATGHRVGITVFNGNIPALATPLGGWNLTQANLIALVNGITAGGTTPLKTGMAVGTTDLNANARNAVGGAISRQIVLLSDGRPNPDGPSSGWGDGTSQRPTLANANSFKAAADEVWSIAIGTGGSGSSNVDTALMAALANPATGHYFNVVDASNLNLTFAAIFHAIACNPHLSITKTSTDTTYSQVGDVLDYTITATNDGDVSIPSVTITDALATLGTCTPANGSALAPTASMTCAATHTVTQGDIDAGHYLNTACVDDGQGGAVEACATKDIPSTKRPHLSISKTSTVTTYSKVGDVLTYTITATNDGNTTLSGVTVTDALAVLGTCTPANGSSLAPGASIVCAASHTVTQGDIDLGTYRNTACVDDGQGPAAQACGDKDIPGERNPLIGLDKSNNSGGTLPASGGEVTYTYVVSNDGNVALTSVVLTDLLCDPGTAHTGDAVNPGVLDVGESWTFTCTSTITQTTTNKADVSAKYVEITVSAHDENTVNVGSGLVVDKSYTGNTGGTGISKVGDTLTFTLAYDVSGDPVSYAVITDTLPVGLDYVAASATNSAEFTFVGYDAGSRTLSWSADDVTADGSVTYQVKVATGSFDLPQPLTNVATIVSEETDPDTDRENVLVQTVQAETDVPTVTLPPTDGIDSGVQAPSNAGFALMLTLLVVAGIAIFAGYIAPSSARSRRAKARRR